MTDAILELLAEEGMSDETELRSFLVALHAEATSVHPVASAAVAELMPARPRRTPRSVLAGRRRIVTSLIVLGSLGAGVGTAAASPDIRSTTQQIGQTVIGAIASIVAPTPQIPAPHRLPSVPHPSSTAGARIHPAPTEHPGNSGNGQSGDLRSHSGSGPAPSHVKGSPSAFPDPAPSDPGQSHRP